MDIWQIVVIVVLAALILVWVAVIAYNKGRVSGRLAANRTCPATRIRILYSVMMRPCAPPSVA